MQYVLAVDGGGTKTHALCADETGKVVGEGMSGPSSLAATSVGAASFNLREAIRQATDNLPPETPFRTLLIGLAGLDTAEDEVIARQVFTQGLAGLNIQTINLVNDTVVALAGGSDAGDAFVLIAGTGSNCYGQTTAGRTFQTGGMDYLLADEGSGYDIGRSVLRAAVKSYDGRGPKTELEQYVCEHFRITSIADLKNKVYTPPLSKTEVAELSQVCLRAFDQGDAVAAQIFEGVVQDLLLMAKTMMTKLDLLAKPTVCVLAGSITKISCVQRPLSDELKKLNSQIEIVTPTQAPVYGALKLALRPPQLGVKS